MEVPTWINDPTAWLGLGTLVVLQIVLGIDNLIFIAILADRLPAHQRNRARLVGLSLALLMRLGLLAGISWIATLTAPLFTVLGSEISWRDIMIVGGLFLLFKGTMELHERLEGAHGHGGTRVIHAQFWQVIAQIVVLDAVFSLDSVITAVGMVDELSVMVIAVVIAVAVMMLASRPLMAFVSRHPTVVILCLGFLLMIGFSLVVEGFGAHIPKGYLYAAIGFSVVIEAFNQIRLTSASRELAGAVSPIEDQPSLSPRNRAPLAGGMRPQGAPRADWDNQGEVEGDEHEDARQLPEQVERNKPEPDEQGPRSRDSSRAGRPSWGCLPPGQHIDVAPDHDERPPHEAANQRRPAPDRHRLRLGCPRLHATTLG